MTMNMGWLTLMEGMSISIVIVIQLITMVILRMCLLWKYVRMYTIIYVKNNVKPIR